MFAAPPSRLAYSLTTANAAGSKLPPAADGACASATCHHQSEREAVSYSGDITQALAQARQAQQRIRAERGTEPNNLERHQPEPATIEHETGRITSPTTDHEI